MAQRTILGSGGTDFLVLVSWWLITKVTLVMLPCEHVQGSGEVFLG
jgi:hypothetical protein